MDGIHPVGNGADEKVDVADEKVDGIHLVENGADEKVNGIHLVENGADEKVNGIHLVENGADEKVDGAEMVGDFFLMVNNNKKSIFFASNCY